MRVFAGAYTWSAKMKTMICGNYDFRFAGTVIVCRVSVKWGCGVIVAHVSLCPMKLAHACVHDCVWNVELLDNTQLSVALWSCVPWQWENSDCDSATDLVRTAVAAGPGVDVDIRRKPRHRSSKLPLERLGGNSQKSELHVWVPGVWFAGDKPHSLRWMRPANGCQTRTQ